MLQKEGLLETKSPPYFDSTSSCSIAVQPFQKDQGVFSAALTRPCWEGNGQARRWHPVYLCVFPVEGLNLLVLDLLRFNRPVLVGVMLVLMRKGGAGDT